jgi:hypothetical protein
LIERRGHWQLVESLAAVRGKMRRVKRIGNTHKDPRFERYR